MKRYDLVDESMEQDEHGTYVKFAEVEVLLVELNLLRSQAAQRAEVEPKFHAVGWYDYGTVKWEPGLRPVNGGLIYVSEVAQSTDMNSTP